MGICEAAQEEDEPPGVQGSDEGGKSQGRDVRDPEQEEHGGTQATATTVAHGGPAGGRSHGGGLQDADQRWWSRWRRSPRLRRRAEEQGYRGGSGGARRIRCCRRGGVDPELQRREEEPRG